MTRRRRLLLGGLTSLALAGRLWIAWSLEGTSDIGRWREFSHLADEGRYDVLYRQKYPLWNHPAPVVGLLRLVGLTQRQLGWSFHFAFKLWPVLADVATGLLLFELAKRRFGERWALLTAFGYLLSPVGIFISAYHGNTDCIMVFWLVVAAALLTQRSDVSALAFGAAISTKYTALLLLPLFLSVLPGMRARLRYAALGLLPVALLSLPMAWSFPSAFNRNILEYSSLRGTWGLWHVRLLLHRRVFGTSGLEWMPATQLLIDNGRAVIVTAVSALAALNVFRQRLDVWQAGALGFAWFFAFTPGFGIQYAVWPLPFFLLAERGLGVAYHLTAAVFVVTAYANGVYDRHGLNDPTLRPSLAAVAAWICTLAIAARGTLRVCAPGPAAQRAEVGSDSTRTSAL